MPDLHERLTVAVNARLEVAREARLRLLPAGPVHFDDEGPKTEYALWLGNKVLGLLVCRPTDHSALAALIDPATVIRHCEADLEIIGWCVEVIGDRDMTGYDTFGSLAHDPQALAVTFAMETLRHLATAYGVEVE